MTRVWATLLDAVNAQRAGTVPAHLPGAASGKHHAALAAAAHEHGVGALVAEAFRSAALPVPEGLGTDVVLGAARHLRALEDLGRVRAALEPVGVPWLVAKGPVLAGTWFGAPYLRAYDDLDVYVAPAAFEAALGALVAAGGVVLDSDSFLRRVVPGEVRIRLATDAAIDLHWQPFFYQVHARRFPVGVATLLERARPWRADDGSPALVPSISDGLVHLCLHAAISGAGRLSWLVDVDRYLATWPLGRADFLEAVRLWQAGAAVALVLARTDATLGSVPARRLLDALPVTTRRAAVAAEAVGARRWPPGVVRSAVTRSAGAGVSDTAAWGGRAAVRRLLPLRSRRGAVGCADYLATVRYLGGGSSRTSRSAACRGSS